MCTCKYNMYAGLSIDLQMYLYMYSQCTKEQLVIGQFPNYSSKWPCKYIAPWSVLLSHVFSPSKHSDICADQPASRPHMHVGCSALVTNVHDRAKLYARLGHGGRVHSHGVRAITKLCLQNIARSATIMRCA